MNESAFQSICNLFDEHRVPYTVLHHEPVGTSEEARQTRERLGYPNVTGAKALLMKLYFSNGAGEKFAAIVVPGDHQLDTDKLAARLPGLKRTRFATREEMAELAGVVPGCMPPFAAPIFPKIPLLIVASALQDVKTVGFNPAYLERSIILKSADYLNAAAPDHFIDCSLPK